MTPYTVLAALLYLFAAGLLATRLFKAEEAADRPRLFLFLTLLGVITHASILFTSLQSGTDLNLGISNAASLMCWFILVFLLLTNLKKPVENLTMLFLPFSALVILLAAAWPTERITAGVFDLSLGLHILLSIAAYSLLSIAALQAMLLAIQEKQLRKKQVLQIIHLLPPLKVMEDVLFLMIAAGFFCLSLSLVSGLMFIHNLFAQHLVHKTFLSILAWVIFAVLLWGRWSQGWRGIKAIRWTLGGFATLVLAYFGTKIVLELILHRV